MHLSLMCFDSRTLLAECAIANSLKALLLLSNLDQTNLESYSRRTCFDFRLVEPPSLGSKWDVSWDSAWVSNWNLLENRQAASWKLHLRKNTTHITKNIF